MRDILYALLLVRFRFNQMKLLAALAIFALMLWGCDMDESFRQAEKTEELHIQRSKDFGKASPVEPINPFSTRQDAFK